VDAAAAQIATTTPVTGMVLARLRRVSSGRGARYWQTHKPMISASPASSGTTATGSRKR
jgi:hypothetical protein